MTGYRIIALLDESIEFNNNEYLFQRSSSPAKSSDELVVTILTWAISDYRIESARSTIAAQLLGRLKLSGVDINEKILNFLGSVGCKNVSQLDKLSKLLTRLAKNKHFDVAAYFRWLIATGSLNGCDSNKIVGFPNFRINGWPMLTARKKISPRARFLQDVPAQEISSSVAALRRQLLRRAGCTSEDVNRLKNIKGAIQNCLPSIFPASSRLQNVKSVSLRDISSLNSYEISEVRSWLKPLVEAAAWSLVDDEP